MTHHIRETLDQADGAIASRAVAARAQIGDVDIAWESRGEGPPILMLNRFRAAMADWDPALLDALAQSHRVITFESAGVGASTGAVPGTLEGAADLAMGLADALDLDRPHLLGWSMGGMIAQILAAKQGPRIGGVVLAGTSPSYRVAGAVPAPDAWMATAAKDSNTPEDMLYLFYADTETSHAAGLASLARIGGGDAVAGARPKTGMQTMAGQFAAARGFVTGEDGWFDKTASIVNPVLVANGDQYKAFPVENSLALIRAIPGAQLAIYPDAGHAFHFQHAASFAADVTRFLAA